MGSWKIIWSAFRRRVVFVGPVLTSMLVWESLWSKLYGLQHLYRIVTVVVQPYSEVLKSPKLEQYLRLIILILQASEDRNS